MKLRQCQSYENHHKAKGTWGLNFHKCHIVSVWGVTPLSQNYPIYMADELFGPTSLETTDLVKVSKHTVSQGWQGDFMVTRNQRWSPLTAFYCSYCFVKKNETRNGGTKAQKMSGDLMSITAWSPLHTHLCPPTRILMSSKTDFPKQEQDHCVEAWDSEEGRKKKLNCEVLQVLMQDFALNKVSTTWNLCRNTKITYSRTSAQSQNCFLRTLVTRKY